LPEEIERKHWFVAKSGNVLRWGFTSIDYRVAVAASWKHVHSQADMEESNEHIAQELLRQGLEIDRELQVSNLRGEKGKKAGAVQSFLETGDPGVPFEVWKKKGDA
jgi:hypothetical protein